MPTSHPSECVLRAIWLPVNQAWTVIYGRKGAPIEQWSTSDICGRRLWYGKVRGRLQLVEDLARVGLRLVPGKAGIIITE